MRVTVIAAFAVVALSVFNGPADAAEFVAYEGKDAIQEGDGGAKKTVDEIDFWSDGAPPRTFKLIGFITDSRMKSGLIGKMRMSGLESSIAKEAKKAGGDAVILMSAETETKGYVGQTQSNAYGNATTTGNTTNMWGHGNANTQMAAVQSQHSRYAVIKYIDDSDDAPDAEVASSTN